MKPTESRFSRVLFPNQKLRPAFLSSFTYMLLYENKSVGCYKGTVVSVPMYPSKGEIPL